MLTFLIALGLEGAFVDLSCHDQILQLKQDLDLKAICQSANFLDWSDSQNPYRKKIACQFPNQESLHVYQDDDLIVADQRNGRSSLTSTITKTENCNDIVSIIEDMANKNSEPLPDSPQRDFQNHESILLVASETNCKTSEDLLALLLETYRAEGRISSQLLCISQSVLKKRNPSTVRNLIAKYKNNIDGIVLVGADIPPFEFFAKSSSTTYDYGESDLPYGEFRSNFWTKPLAKKDKKLFNKVYFERGNIYKTQSPSPYAFDLESLVLSDIKASSSTGPQKWVTRLPVTHRESLKAFVTRRSAYRPRVFQNAVFTRGSESLMFKPYDFSLRTTISNRMAAFKNNLPLNSQFQILESSLLEATLSFLDHETTFLALDEHGNPGNLGDLSADDLLSKDFLPEIVHFDSCLVGSWTTADTYQQSLLMTAFSLRSPPLALLASQGIKYIPTMGAPDPLVSDIFFAHIRPGLSLGMRQIENFSNIIKFWSLSEARTIRRLELPAQLWHSLSLFGDGSIEF